MRFLPVQILRPISVFLVILFLLPSASLFAQRRQAPAVGMPSQFFSPDSRDDRLGGTSFGSKSRKDKANPFQSQIPQIQRPSAADLLQGPTYQVHILGEVENPGTFRVPASTRLSEAVQLAGGLLERGAMRGIQLRRKGSKTRWIDLLSFKMMGNLDANPYLLDNDVVFVPLKKNVIQIAGAVKRPDSYEMTGKATLYRLLKLAGGFAPGVAKQAPAKVIRYVNGHKELIDVDLDKSSMSQFRVHGADIVVIPHLLTEGTRFDYNVPNLPGDSEVFFPSFEERVFVLGAVFQPGPYAFSPYYKVREYLTQAGGLTRLAKSEKKIYIMSALGKKIKAENGTQINPGDTIIVPERYMAPETLLTLILTITSTAVGITATVLAIAK